MTSTEHPESYYDAKRALLAKAGPWEARGSLELRQSIPAALDALGWAEPEPVKDERGKPVRVWIVGLYYVLPEDPFGAWEAEAAAEARRQGRQFNQTWVGYVVAANKTAAIDAVYGPDRTSYRRPKTSEVREANVTDLGYEAAVSGPTGSVAVKRGDATFIVVAPDQLRKV